MLHTVSILSVYPPPPSSSPPPPPSPSPAVTYLLRYHHTVRHRHLHRSHHRHRGHLHTPTLSYAPRPSPRSSHLPRPWKKSAAATTDRRGGYLAAGVLRPRNSARRRCSISALGTHTSRSRRRREVHRAKSPFVLLDGERRRKSPR